MAAEVERSYECPRCGVKAIVAVIADGAKAPAREADANRALRLARCPSCGERPAHVVARAAVRISVIAIGAAVAFWMLGAAVVGMRYDQLAQLWAMEPVVMLAVGGWLASATLRRWRATADLRVVRELAPARPVEALPKAVATIAPASAPAPVAPVASRAPERVETSDPAAGPRHLR